MASMGKSVPKILLLLLCACCSLSIARAGDARSYKVLATGSPNPEAAVCSSPPSETPSSTQSTVPLNHRHGPCSPVPSAMKHTIVELLDKDKLRAEFIQRKFSTESGAGGAQQLAVTVPTVLGFALDTAEYVITVSIGSPAVKQTLIMDTGSDVSWVHCMSGSLFSPSKSSTYALFPCNSTACAQLAAANYDNGCSNSQCQYIVKYIDGSNTTGTYGSDTMALTDSVVVNNFRFGCSLVDQGFDDKTDGLMGLGGDTESLVSQTAMTYGKAFSYCLPPSLNTSGFLTLGAPSSSNASGFVTTPMLRSKQVPTFYGVRLQGIAVNGALLSIPTSVFSAGNGTLILDSGTIITRLPATAYSVLRSAFKDGMKQYPLAKAKSILDTCFDFTGYTSISLPSVALVFSGGAVIDLPDDGIMFGSCLAFAAARGLGFIGNVQQRTFEVLHDVGNSVVGFRPGAC